MNPAIKEILDNYKLRAAASKDLGWDVKISPENLLNLVTMIELLYEQNSLLKTSNDDLTKRLNDGRM